MSMTIERPPAAHDVAGRPSRNAWVAIALTPLSLIAGMAAGLALATMLGVDLMPASGVLNMPVWKYLLVEVPVDLVALTAPVVGLVQGVRAARSGNRRGLAAAIVAAVVILALVAWFAADAAGTKFA